MAQSLLRNFELLDPEMDTLQGGHEVLIEGDRIKEVSAKPIKAAKAAIIDCGRRTLMPGLIDAHVHVTLSEVYIRQLENIPLTLMTARAIDLMRGMLDRGFTTVRDTGGADWGIKAAVDQGLCAGPRLFIAGRAIGRAAIATGGGAPMRAAAAAFAATRSNSRWRFRTAPTMSARLRASRCARGATRSRS